MASTQTSSLVPVEEYLSTDYRPDCDYVEGVILERNVGEKDHNKLQKALLFYLGAREKDLGIFVIHEQRLKISPARYRVPDFCVVAGPEPDKQVFDEPPLICVEILSPEDRMSRMQERIDDYLEFGVKQVWVIDPRTRRAWVYSKDNITEAQDGILRMPAHGDVPEIVVPLHELF